MKEMLKPIFEWVTGNYSLFDNPLYNYCSMAVVGFLAFVFAWNFVGSLYAAGVIEGRVSGSIIHWTVRFIAFVIIFTAFSVVIWIVKLIISVPVWVWWSLLGIIALVIMILIIGYFAKRKGERLKSDIEE